jgi:hypothetical protein
MESLEQRNLLSAGAIATVNLPNGKVSPNKQEYIPGNALLVTPPDADQPWHPIVKFHEYLPDSDGKDYKVTFQWDSNGSSTKSKETHVSVNPDGDVFANGPEHTYPAGEQNLYVYIRAKCKGHDIFRIVHFQFTVTP